MNNKGFTLLESVIVTSIIIVFLLSSYTLISKIISNYNVREKYDSIENIYKLNTVKTFIYSYGNVNEIIYNSSSKRNYAAIDATHLKFSDTKYNNIYKDLLDDMGIEKVYYIYTKYIVNPPSIDTNINDTGLNRYINYAIVRNKYPYRIVAKFENDEYAQIKIWEVSE